VDEGVFGRAAQERAIAEVETEMARLCEMLAEGLAMGVEEGREMVGGAMSEFLVEFFDLVRAQVAVHVAEESLRIANELADQVREAVTAGTVRSSRRVTARRGRGEPWMRVRIASTWL